MMSATLLDEAYEQQFIDAADYTRFRDGYQKQHAFIDSARLNSFRYSDLSPDTTIDAPTRSIPAPETPASPATETLHTAFPEDAVPRISKPPYGEGGFIHPELLIGDLSPRQALRMGGGALTGVDAYQITVRSSELWSQDNATAANEQWARFGARIIPGLDKTDLHYSSEKVLIPNRLLKYWLTPPKSKLKELKTACNPLIAGPVFVRPRRKTGNFGVRKQYFSSLLRERATQSHRTLLEKDNAELDA